MWERLNISNKLEYNYVPLGRLRRPDLLVGVQAMNHHTPANILTKESRKSFVAE